jgi:hypothetical protein
VRIPLAGKVAVLAEPDVDTRDLALVRDEAQVLELRAAGADECLLKPFGPIELRGFFERDPEGP